MGAINNEWNAFWIKNMRFNGCDHPARINMDFAADYWQQKIKVRNIKLENCRPWDVAGNMDYDCDLMNKEI